MDFKERIKDTLLNNMETWFKKGIGKYYKIRAANLDKMTNELHEIFASLPSEEDILSEAKARQLDGAEPYSFAAGARWVINYKKYD